MSAPDPYRLRLERLAASLPSIPASIDDVDTGARTALGWLAIKAVSCRHGLPASLEPGHCPNCGVPHRSSKSPYCSACCKDQAGLVRQLRAGIAEGTIDDVDRQIALGEKLWRVLGGGFPRRRALLPVKGWERVLEREKRICQLCGAPATTIDHIGTG